MKIKQVNCDCESHCNKCLGRGWYFDPEQLHRYEKPIISHCLKGGSDMKLREQRAKNRKRLFKLLKELGEATVSELQEKLELSQQSVGTYLSYGLRSGFLKRKKERYDDPYIYFFKRRKTNNENHQ